MIYNEKDFEDEEYSVEPVILSDGDKFNEHYGVDFVLLNDEHIKALQEGKALYVDINCGEYCCLLKRRVR